MSRRCTYKDECSGDTDRKLLLLLGENDGESDELRTKLKKILLNVIKNELTPRQKEIIMLYYFKKKNIVEIAALTGVSPQAVSAAMKRARLTMFRYLKYTVYNNP